MIMKNESYKKDVKIYLTGKPGVGKTTCIRKIVEGIRSAGREPEPNIRGFFTEEIREKGRRVGFAAENFEGEREILSHIKVSSPLRVGKYRVDVKSFEKIAIPALDIATTEYPTVFVIDEIGKMECFSSKFREHVKRVSSSTYPVVATMPVKKPSFVEDICSAPEAEVIEISTDNRDDIPSRVVETILQVLPDEE